MLSDTERVIYLKALFLIIFIVSSVIHLYASLKCNKKLRAYTKVFIVSSLLGWYCCAASVVRPIIIIALFFSWLGDVLLIPHGTKWFTAGGIAFMVSHFAFILAYYPQIDFPSIPIWVIVIAALVYFLAVTLIFIKLKQYLPKMLFYPMYLYLLINGAMNCFALFRLISMPCRATLITFIGAVLFFMSDSTLFFVRFNKDGKLKTHFTVMLTYIFAEFLIVLGLI